MLSSKTSAAASKGIVTLKNDRIGHWRHASWHRDAATHSAEETPRDSRQPVRSRGFKRCFNRPTNCIPVFMLPPVPEQKTF